MNKHRNKQVLRLIFLCIAALFSVGAHYYQVPSNRQNHPSRIRHSNFGKTHFIIGLSKEETEAVRTAQASCTDPDDTPTFDEVYFSPEDDLQKQLIRYIEQEKTGILLAIFSFTDKQIAQALVRAKERGISVEIIVDPGFLYDRYTKIDWLFEQGIPIFVYNPKLSPKNLSTLSNIMHHKFVVFLKNIDDRTFVWTGSFNFTKSARLSNQENAVILSSPKITNRYMEKFRQLKRQSFEHSDTQALYGRTQKKKINNRI